jgi:hypothetical protein
LILKGLAAFGRFVLGTAYRGIGGACQSRTDKVAIVARLILAIEE